MKKFLTVLLSVATMAAWNSAQASHVAGADITYECLGNNQYFVTLNVYRDCFGLDMDATETIDLASSCGSSLSASLPLEYSEEVSQLCEGELQNSTCNGGSLPGMEIYVYSGIVTLDPVCDNWTISWQLCCRNELILNLDDPDGQDMYIESTINSASFACDNSPVFNNLHIPYVCVNSPVAYSYGVSEIDGDSLTYELVNALGPNNLLYVGGFSALEPIPGITIDWQTGLLQFTPTMIGTFVVVVQISQWDEDGNLIGTIMRDVQFVVINCTGNQPPLITDGTIEGLTGNAIQTGDYNIEMCENDQFCFDFTINDPDVNDTLNLISTVEQTLPGATFQWTGINPVTGTICWTAPPLSQAFYSFIITAEDGGCPVFATQTYGYSIEVLHTTTVNPDVTICGDQVANLEAIGGVSFTWEVLSGDPITSANFECDTCQTTWADPDNTTTYLVTSDLSNTCSNSDTVTVFVVPDFSFDVTQQGTSGCLGDTIQFNVSVDPDVPGYEYLWTPSTFLNANNIANPVGDFTVPGTYNYVVEISSPDGCAHLDTTVIVDVYPAYVPEFTVSQSDNALCAEGSTQFFVELDSTVPGQCGPNQATCSGTVTELQVGEGTTTNSTTSYPSVYGNFYWGCRTQMLIRANELWNLGFTGGTFSSIGFEVVAPLTGNADYQNWEMKMGCTTENELNTWLGGLTNVYPSATVTPVQGMNTYDLATNYNWDGVSNIVVEVCFNNTGFDDNLIQEHTPTTFNSSITNRADNGDVCPSPVVFSVDQLRPNIFFGVCTGVDTTNITYTWNPSMDFNDPNISNPVVTPSGLPSSYTITVVDTVSGCSADTVVSVLLAQDYSGFQLDTALCEGDSTQFFTTYDGSNDPINFVYDWTPANDLSDPSSANPFVTPESSPVTYTMSVLDTVNGCAWDTTYSVSWYPGGDISFDPSVFEGVAPLNVVFTNTSASGSTGFFWDFGDSTNTSNQTNPSFTFTEPGEYWVTLFGLNEFGCASTWQELIIVVDDPVIVIPNVFSPNGDGSNDVFAFGQYQGFRSFTFQVFNRWGQEVHSTSSISDNLVVWRADTSTPEGTYFYVFNGRAGNGEDVVHEGHITLVR